MIYLNGHFIGKFLSILHVTEVFLFSIPKKKRNYIWWLHQKVCEALTFQLDNNYIRFGTKYLDKLWVFRWVRIAHCLWLIYSCSVMKGTSRCLFPRKSNLKLLKPFSSASRYLDDLSSIDNKYFNVWWLRFILQGWSPIFAFVYFKWIYFIQNSW